MCNFAFGEQNAVRSVIRFLIGLPVIALLTAGDSRAANIPMIDAHSQLPDPAQASEVIPLMDKAGIRHIILSFRERAKWKNVLDLARSHPGRITPAVKVKSRHWPTGNPRFFKIVKNQLRSGRAGAMGEALLYHAQKGNKAPEVEALPDSKQFKFVLKTCRKNGWPLIVHIEFRAARNPAVWMERLEALLAANRDVNFPLIHVGQLDHDEVARLIDTHPNIYFMVSQSNSISVRRSKQPWTNLFAGQRLKPEWQALMEEHSDRFILNFDNVWTEHWREDFYVAQARLWQGALKNLPVEAAHNIAHRNAERLWKLPAVH